MIDSVNLTKKLGADPDCTENPLLLVMSNNLIFVQVLIVRGKSQQKEVTLIVGTSRTR